LDTFYFRQGRVDDVALLLRFLFLDRLLGECNDFLVLRIRIFSYMEGRLFCCRTRVISDVHPSALNTGLTFCTVFAVRFSLRTDLIFRRSSSTSILPLNSLILRNSFSPWEVGLTFCSRRKLNTEIFQRLQFFAHPCRQRTPGRRAVNVPTYI
jgi:hypothetical protein